MLSSTRISILSAAIVAMCLHSGVNGAEGAAPRANALTVVNLGVVLSFTMANSDAITLTATDPLATGTSTAGLAVSVSVGGVTQAFTLDATGSSNVGGNAFVIVNNQAIVALQGSFAATLASLGLTNATVAHGAVSIPVSITFGATTYSATESGFYVATQNLAGTFSSTAGTGAPPKGGASVAFASFTATPNPANIGTAVNFTATFAGKLDTSSGSAATLDPGDGTAPIALTNANLTSSSSGAATYTYTTAGAFQAVLTITGPTQTISATVFVVVGQSTDVNAINGLASTATVANSKLALSISIARLTTAVTASTVFSDTLGRDAPVIGLNVSRAYSTATMSVATTTAEDASNAAVGMARKTVAVSDLDVNNPSALPLPPSSALTKVKMTGKFLFSASKPDQVSFSGSVQLPAGFNPNASGGNLFVAGIGNVVGSVPIGSKGKPTGTSTTMGAIKSVTIKYPKLSGQAVGGETATLSVTLSAPNLSQAGFDTEGITQTLRTDEKGFKVASRFIQTNFLLGGVKYEGYIPVAYKLASNGSSGSIGGRSAQ